MKVLFIYPNLHAQIGFNYGVAFLSAVLRAHGHETALINVNDKLYPAASDDELVERVREEGPGLVAFSVVTTQYRYAVDMAAAIRRELPGIPTAIGGIHATMDPEGCLEAGVFDYVCVGEGEEALLELVEKIEKGDDTAAIRNIWTMRNGAVSRNAVRPFISLDELPSKDYCIFDFQHMIDAKDGWVGLMASRGCPFRCSYCFNHRMVALYEKDTGLTGKALGYIRHHTVDELIDEIEYLLANYENIRMFIFDDDLFTFDKEYVRDFCARYRNVTDVPFVCNAHARFFDEETAQLLKDGNCRIVKFGLESGSDRVRKEVMHRVMTDDQIEKAFTAGNAAGLHTSAFVMMGLPTETPAEMDETIDLLARIKPGRFRWAIFFPFVSTDAYDMAKEQGLIDFEKMRSMPNFTDDSCLVFPPAHSLKIKRLRAAFPWYVNARSDDPSVSRLFSRLTSVIDNLDEKSFDDFKSQIISFDGLLGQVLASAGHDHYAVRYNSFTAVTSQWND